MLLKKNVIFLLITVFVFSVTFFQWYPTFKFVSLSARTVDQQDSGKDGFFLPKQNLLQFIAPDFFGNPAKGNYWGVWNYGEFIGYIGLVPLIFAVYCLLFRRDRKTLFFSILLFASLIFTLSTPLGKLPFIFKVPFISSSQPTRLIFLVDFCLCMLAALGYDYFFVEKERKKIFFLLSFITLLFISIWLVVSFPLFPVNSVHGLIAKRNLILPSLFFSSIFLIFIFYSLKKISRMVFVTLLLSVSVIDLFGFGWKYTPFVNENWIFPKTGLISRIQEDKGGNPRIMVTDRRIMPPNSAAYYRISDVSGYDPLYLLDYNKFVSAWERDKPDTDASSFNRIVTPINYNSFVYDLLGVKYMMSFDSLKSKKFALLEKEGQTFLYENREVFPRVFIAEKTVFAKDAEEAIKKMWDLQDKLRSVAVVTDRLELSEKKLQNETVTLSDYEENFIRMITKTDVGRLVVLTDIYYPSWSVYIDKKLDKIYKVDYLFRGVIVPKGEHVVEFKANLL